MKARTVWFASYSLISGAVLLSLLATRASAQIHVETGSWDRDKTYEQNLRWEAGPDKTITPAKVIRWMMSYRGQPTPPPSNTEFQPIVNVHNGQRRLVAAIAYKF